VSAEVLRYAAFTMDGAGGNPAGVVLDAGLLTDPEMLAIARAIGYSETAFVTSSGNTIRFFSPVAEVAFCGHATVAAAVATAERHGPGTIRFTSRAGVVSVTTRLDGGTLVATLTSPPTATRPVDGPILDEALTALGWARDDLDTRFPVHVANAGNNHLILGVRDRATLAGLAYDFPALDTLMARERWTTAHLFHAAAATTFHARNAFPPGGVVEDPATGAAAAAFGGYLRDLRLVPPASRVVVLQGHDMGAPSRLVVDLVPGTRTVRVTGSATRLALSPYDTHDALPAR
jgi:PhzF family phenazine biosynthesis protein